MRALRLAAYGDCDRVDDAARHDAGVLRPGGVDGYPEATTRGAAARGRYAPQFKMSSTSNGGESWRGEKLGDIFGGPPKPARMAGPVVGEKNETRAGGSSARDRP